MDNLDQFSASNKEKEIEASSRPQASLSDIAPSSSLLPATLPKRKGRGLLIILLCLIAGILAATGVGAAAYFGYITLPINIPYIQPDPQQVIKKMYLKMSELKAVGYGAEMKIEVRTEDSAGIDAPVEEISEYRLTTRRFPKNSVYSGVISVEGESDWIDKENVKFDSKLKTSFISSEASMLLGGFDNFKFGLETKGGKKMNYFRITEMPALPFFDISALVNKWIKIDYSTGTMAQFAGLQAKIEDAQEKSALTPEQEKQIKEAFVKFNVVKVVKKFPEEKINNTAVHHYRFNLDKEELKKAAEEVNRITDEKVIPENFMADFYQGIDNLNMFDGEMWIGKKDNYLYRLSVASSTYGGEAGEKMFMGISLVLNLNKFNEPVVVEAPADAVSFEDIIKGIFDPMLSEPRAKAADAKRFADIKMVQTALELYYNDNSCYPSEVDFSGLGSIKTATTTYMVIVPSNPEPRDSGSCVGENYSYKAPLDGKSYEISFCLSQETSGINAGNNVATPSGINRVEPVISIDEKRVSDIKKIQTALELYYNDNNRYPEAVDFSGAGSIGTDKVAYMSVVPSNPEPRANSNCVGENYSYTAAPDGQDYLLLYCLGEKTGWVPAGKNAATFVGISGASTVQSVLDSDNDGLTDYEERSMYKTDSYNSDTDGDGYKDGDEVKNGYNPNGPGKLSQPEL